MLKRAMGAIAVAGVSEMLGRSAAARYSAVVVMIVSAVVFAPATAAAQEGGFNDVAEGVHKPAIDALADRGVFEGTLCGEEMFCPSEPISRSDMAVWLIRALGDDAAPATGTTRFADVDASEWWAPYVERLADLGITSGCRLEPLRYCPDVSVSRGQMASFLVRAFELEPAEPAGFTDIEGSAHEANINALAAAGITVGCSLSPLRFCAGDPVRRSHMASFLARALGLVVVPSSAAPDASGRRMVAFGLITHAGSCPTGICSAGTSPTVTNSTRRRGPSPPSLPETGSRAGCGRSRDPSNAGATA